MILTAALVLITLGLEIFFLGFLADRTIMQTLLMFGIAIFLVTGIPAEVGLSGTMVPRNRGKLQMSFTERHESRQVLGGTGSFNATRRSGLRIAHLGALGVKNE
jgi:hypothetical protein